MIKLHTAALSAAAVLLLAGCSKPPELMLQKLSPTSPAAEGFPAPPLDGEKTPLSDRSPFGLYATYPSNDTLERLSTGTLSPDGRFRFAFTDQGVWVTRIDGAWLWQVPLPEEGATPPPVPQPPTAQGGVKPAPPPPPPPKGTKYVGPTDWTPRNTLLLQDDVGTWIEAAPWTTQVTLLPQPLQGKDGIQFSPDGKQVIYYVPGKTGMQLWLAGADGANAKFQGENVTGFWDKTGKLQVQRNVSPQAGPSGKKALAPDLQFGPDRE